MRWLFAQYFFFGVVVSFLVCYFSIKYLYYLRSNLKNFIHKKRTYICEVYLKNVVFLVIPLSYWNEAQKLIFHFQNFFAKLKGVHSTIKYWSKVNSTIKFYTIQATTRFIFPGKICDDISYSTFLEGYISNNNHKKSIKWVYNLLLKWQSFSLMDNTLYLMACKIGLPCKS